MKVPEEIGRRWIKTPDYGVFGTPAERVERGIAWLQQVVGPDWASKVELVDFDFGDPCRCVLGFTVDEDLVEERTGKAWPYRAAEGFTLGLSLAEELGEVDEPWSGRYVWADYHGFDGNPRHELAEEWRNRILEAQRGG